MEIRENTYIDASRAREAGITEEMVRESVNRIDGWRYSDNTWYVCNFGELCSHSGKFTTYVFNYGGLETDVTDEFIEWFKPSKKEFDVYQSGWYINGADISLHRVNTWLELNTTIKWYDGANISENVLNNLQCIFADSNEYEASYLNAYDRGSAREHPSTPEALTFFKKKLNIKEEEENIKTISYEDVQENFLDSGELEGKLWGSLDITRLKEAGLEVVINCDNILGEKYLKIWASCSCGYSNTLYDTDLTDAFIKKYGDTTKEGLDVLNLNYSQLESFEGEWLVTETKQKHKAYEKLFK